MNYFYLSFVLVFCFLFLNVNRDLPISFYVIGGNEYFPVAAGILISFFLFFILDRKFGSLNVFFVSILLITSGFFVKNFSKGENINFFESNIFDFIFFIPFAISLSWNLFKRKKFYFFVPILLILIPLYFQITVILLAVACAYSLDSLSKEDKIQYVLFSFFSIFIILVSIFSIANSLNEKTILLSLLFSTISLFLFYQSEINFNPLILLLIFSSIIFGVKTSFEVERMDPITLEVIEKMKSFENFSIVSTYENKINQLIDSRFEEGLLTLFDENKVKYIAVEKKIIERPYYYASKVNKSPNFETFVLTEKKKIDEFYYYFFKSEKSELVVVGDEGKYYQAYLNGEREDIDNFFEFEGYLIYPRDKSNTLKILFPKNFGGNSKVIFENEKYVIWELGG
ncbi:MAG: hypothetical protein QXI58_01565 [Candidatus Micrarchaeia archaeon]